MAERAIALNESLRCARSAIGCTRYAPHSGTPAAPAPFEDCPHRSHRNLLEILSIMSLGKDRWLKSLDSVETCPPQNVTALGSDQNSKRPDSNNAATQTQWSRTEERMLSERSRAIPDEIPKIAAPATMRSD